MTQDADRFVSMVAGYYTLPSKEMCERFPEYAALDLKCARPMEAVMRFFCQTAIAIETRRAETSGSVEDESAGLAEASPHPTPEDS